MALNQLSYYYNLSIYKIITSKYNYLSAEEINIKIIIFFKKMMNNIRIISNTDEIDKFNTPMGFLFQHLKPDIISLIANCTDTSSKEYINKHLIYNLHWNIFLANTIIKLNSKDIFLWYFLHVPYYFNSQIDIINFRSYYENFLDYLLTMISNNNFPKNLFFQNMNLFLYQMKPVCLMHYHIII